MHTTYIMYWILSTQLAFTCSQWNILFLSIPSQSPPINALGPLKPYMSELIKKIPFFRILPCKIPLPELLSSSIMSQDKIHALRHFSTCHKMIKKAVNVSSNKPLPKKAENDRYSLSQANMVFFLDPLKNFRGSFLQRVKGRKLLQELRACL